MKRTTAVTVAALGLLAAVPTKAESQGVYITAALTWPGGKAQFFLSDGTFVRYDIAADHADPGYPLPVTDRTWPGLGPHARQIVAAVNSRDPRKVFFFLSNGTYIRFDIVAGSIDRGYPQPIDNRTWPGMGPYATKIFGSLNWSATKLMFFLNDGTYICYDTRADHVDAGFPQRITQKTWPGLAPYAAHLAGGVNWTNGKAYIFLDDGRYVRFDTVADHVDAGYPKPIDSRTWPGLHGYFRHR